MGNNDNKEALQNREAAQKVAVQALKDASATENLVRVLKMFSDLSSKARPISPVNSFDRFLDFHQEIVQAVVDMKKVQVEAVLSPEQDSKEDSSILQEIVCNSPGDSKKPSIGSSQLRSHNNKKASSNRTDEKNTEQQQNSSSTSLGSSIKLAKQLQAEVGSWFMDYLESALEEGLKKGRGGGGDGQGCPQSLILKVINWVEVEQSDSIKRPGHPRAAQIARKLRIKAKNP